MANKMKTAPPTISIGRLGIAAPSSPPTTAAIALAAPYPRVNPTTTVRSG